MSEFNYLWIDGHFSINCSLTGTSNSWTIPRAKFSQSPLVYLHFCYTYLLFHGAEIQDSVFASLSVDINMTLYAHGVPHYIHDIIS